MPVNRHKNPISQSHGTTRQNDTTESFYMHMSLQDLTQGYDRNVRVVPGTPLAHKDFVRLIEPSLPTGGWADDLAAVLRRSGFIAVTPTFVAYRVASRAEAPVPTICWSAGEDVELFTPAANEEMMAYRRGSSTLPANFPHGDCRKPL